MVTAASSTSAVTTYLRRRAVALQAHAVVDGGDHEAAEHGVDRLAPAAEQAGPADDRGGDRVEHERAAVEGGRHRPQPRGVDDAGDAGGERRRA